MTVDMGRFGVWGRVGDISEEHAREAEKLGFGAIWVGGSPPGDLDAIEGLIAVTERIPVVTGIVNMWRAEPAEVARSYHRIEASHPGRFVLGLGIGHPEAVESYAKPYDTMVAYMDEIDGAGVPRDRVVLAALGPRVLRLSAERSAGAHPYLTTPRHTRFAREILGDGPLLAPEQKVILDGDANRGRVLARANMARYLRLMNYRTNLFREGWTEDDLSGDGSDRLVDELVLHGELDHLVAGLRAHIEAGADHVGIQVLGDDPVAGYRLLADALLRA
jgi:probable F420-dependent oxidoreductase